MVSPLASYHSSVGDDFPHLASSSGPGTPSAKRDWISFAELDKLTLGKGGASKLQQHLLLGGQGGVEAHRQQLVFCPNDTRPRSGQVGRLRRRGPPQVPRSKQQLAQANAWEGRQKGLPGPVADEVLRSPPPDPSDLLARMALHGAKLQSLPQQPKVPRPCEEERGPGPIVSEAAEDLQPDISEEAGTFRVDAPPDTSDEVFPWVPQSEKASWKDQLPSPDEPLVYLGQRSMSASARRRPNSGNRLSRATSAGSLTASPEALHAHEQRLPVEDVGMSVLGKAVSGRKHAGDAAARTEQADFVSELQSEASPSLASGSPSRWTLLAPLQQSSSAPGLLAQPPLMDRAKLVKHRPPTGKSLEQVLWLRHRSVLAAVSAASYLPPKAEHTMIWHSQKQEGEAKMALELHAESPSPPLPLQPRPLSELTQRLQETLAANSYIEAEPI